MVIMRCRALIAVFILCACAFISAQDETPTRITVQNQHGDLPYSQSVGTDIEHVDVASLGLVVKVPLVSVKGRGMDYTLAARWHSQFWVTATRSPAHLPPFQIWNVEKRNYLALGWELNQPTLTWINSRESCGVQAGSTGAFWHKSFIYHDADGGSHMLGVRTATGSCDGGTFQLDDDDGPDMTGEGMFAHIGGTSIGIRLGDGTYIPGPAGFGGFPSPGEPYDGNLAVLSSMTDANGNMRQLSPTGQDTLGRSLVSETDGSSFTTYTVNDSGGTPRSYTINYTPIGVATAFNASDVLGHISDYGGTRSTVSSISLPNGSSYAFQYESGTYGGITGIDLPAGAHVSYTWGTISAGDHTRRYVASRAVTVNGTTFVWSFHPTCTDTVHCISMTVSVTDPVNNVTEYDVNAGNVTSVRIYEGAASGSPLRRYDLIYNGYPSNYDNGDSTFQLPHIVRTTLENGLVSEKQYDYDSVTFTSGLCNDGETCATSAPDGTVVQSPETISRGNVVETREYDWGQGGVAGPLLRRTHNTYLHDTQPTKYLPPNIVDKIVLQSTYDSLSDTCKGIAQPCSQTAYEYDGTPIVDGSTTYGQAPQHDYTNYPASYTTRGNATAVKQWLDPAHLSAQTQYPDGWIPTKYTYDELGNILSKEDPQHHVTTWSYADDWANGACPPSSNSRAFVTQATDALGHRVKLQHYPCTSLVYSHRDENDLRAGRLGTLHQYDSMGRPTVQTFPDGNVAAPAITYGYVDTVPVSVTKTDVITSAADQVKPNVSHILKSEMDGLGRLRKTTLLSDPDGTTYARIAYDGLGRKSQEWNATRCDPDTNTTSCPGETTYGITSYEYDALGRATKMIPPDGTSLVNYVRTDYLDNSTTVTDQAGKQRRTFADALGRLLQVDEPGTTLVPATGSTAIATVTGAERSIPDPTKPPTSGSGTIAISGTERTTLTGGHPATGASGSIMIGGVEGSITECDPDIVLRPGQTCPKITIKDSGTVTLTVNGVPYATSYGSTSTAASVATGIYNAINANTTGPVMKPVLTTSQVSFVSRSAGSSVNYSISAVRQSTDPNGDFGVSGWFTATASGPTMTGGTDAFAGNTVYDTGTVTVTVNGYREPATYGQGSTSGAIAAALASAFQNDPASPVNASAIGGSLTLTTRASGAATNYPLSTSASTSSANFTGTSFTPSSGATLAGGSSPAVFDSGTVSLTVNAFTASSSYSQTSTTSNLASALASALSTAASPVTATASGATISMTSKAAGATVNYAMSSASNTSLQASFTGSSFSAGVSGANMAGGTDPTTSTASLTTPWTTLYAYDTLGNLTCVEQHGGVSGTGCSSPESSDASSPWRVRRFTYNSLSDLITAKNPESGTISYNYNDDGVLTSKTDARGITVTYDPADSPIDELHRVTKKTYSNSDPAVVYSYDNPAVPESIGRRTGMTDASGSTAWTYDDMGRVLTENRTILGVTKATSMQYSVGGFLEKLTYPTGSVVQMTPSGAGHELDAKDLTHGINYATGAKYAPGGQLTDVSVGGVINGKFSFNSRTQPIHLIYTTGALPSATELAAGSCATSAVGTLMDRVYGFASGTANNGNVLTIKNCRDFNRGQTFSYDALNRISRAITSGPNWGESFTIDAWGNLTNRTQLPGKISYEPFNAAPAGADPTPLSHNQLVGYAYDAAGNMLTGPSGASTIAYDAENRISTAGIWSYVYDGEGTRAAKASSGVVSKIYWRGGGSDVLGESDGPGSFTEEYVFFNGRRIGRRDVATGGVEYYLSDHLGTASVIATNLGGNKEESDYYPFGGEIPISGADSNNYKFTTKERDSETGFDYFGARYYVSSIGRWMNPDWADKPEPVPYSSLDNSQSLNLYVYVLNNPLSKADPDGHCCEWAKQQVQVAQRWTADHPRTMMAAKAVGTGLATAAVVTVVVVSAPVSVPATLLTGAAMMGAAGGTVATVTLATGAITGNTKGINDAAEAVQTVSNVAGLAVTVGSGSLEKGSKAAAASDLVTGGKDALGHVDKDVAAAGKLASGLVHAGGAQTAASAAQTLTKPQGPEKKETDQKEK